MTIDVYSSVGEKSGSLELPPALFAAPINKGLMHLALVRQLSNRRMPIAHVKTRGEIVGSTKKLFQQKGTGRARRGPVRSPLLKGGGKTFGPRNNANYVKEMPKKMRRNALFSCLSHAALTGSILALENYPEEMKTKAFTTLLKKLPVELGRRILVVLPAHHRGLELSARNIPRVKTLLAPYLNPQDVLQSRHIIFLVDAIKVAEETFTKKSEKQEKSEKSKRSAANADESELPVLKKTRTAAKKPKLPSAKKSSASSKSSHSSDSSK